MRQTRHELACLNLGFQSLQDFFLRLRPGDDVTQVNPEARPGHVEVVVVVVG